VIIGDYHIRPDKSKRNYMNSLAEFGHGVIEKYDAVYYKAASGKYCRRLMQAGANVAVITTHRQNILH
jgi:hypothetical protein